MSQLDQLVKYIQDHINASPESSSGSGGKMSLAQKKMTLHNIYLEMQRITDRKEVTLKQKEIEPLLFTLCEMGCGVSLVNEIMTLLSYFYTYGDYAAIPIMLEKLRDIFENSKNLYSKTCACRLTGKIFEKFWKRMISPPTNETVQSLLKMMKNSTEWFTKDTAIETLDCILKTKSQSIDAAASDIHKLIFKGIAEKVKDLRLSCTKALLHFTQATDLFKELKADKYQAIVTATIRGFADNDEGIRSLYAEIMKEILCYKISFEMKQIPLDVDPKMASSKKKLLESFPNDMLELIDYLDKNILNGPDKTNARVVTHCERKTLIQCILFAIQEYPVLLEKTNKSKLIPKLLSLTANSKISAKYQPARSEIIISNRLVAWLLIEIANLAEHGDKVDMLKIITAHLQKRDMPNSDLSILLNMFNAICHDVECIKVFDSDHAFTDILMPFIKSGLLETQIPAVEILKTVSHNMPNWIHPLISTLVSHTSITHAELAGLQFVPIYTQKILPEVLNSYNKDEVKKSLICLSQVNMLAHALALVFSSVNHSLKGVPITLSNSSFNAAKAMILGNFQTEDDEEDIVSVGLDDFDITDSPRREAGWILLEGLLHLGNQWVGFKVTTVYKLWNSVFCKDMCDVNTDRIKSKDLNYIEKILTEFKIKKQALSTIK